MPSTRVTAVLILALIAGIGWLAWPDRPASSLPPVHSGSESCLGCHQDQHRQWQQSDHHHAMAPATEQTVLGNFNNASFRYFGRTSRFHRQDSLFLVSTENEQGKTQTFTVKYTLGYRPLQQYLVEFADGRIQTLPFAWDTRSQQEGGQRWFHLYPDENITPDNPLFWTRPLQNWNHMCADCHVTGFEKKFSADTNTFHSRWNELANGCESCHGPGSAHVAQMKKNPGKENDFHIISLRTQEEQISQCGVCHARRDRLQENPVREKIMQTWRPELLHEPLYFHDGQIQDEVFEIGSFLQSKMHGAGVTCTNCHDAHTQKLKAEGNALCAQCHSSAAYDTPQHHFHPANTAGARCTSCHMPSRTYMVVNERHDHRFSIPRPDLSDTLGTPNACTSCHANQTNRWAAQHIDKTVRAQKGEHALPDHFGLAFWQARREQLAAAESLAQLIRDPATRPIVRATGLAELPSAMGERSFALLQEQLRDPDPLVRLGAAQALPALPEDQRHALLVERLEEDVRGVRFALAPMLAALEIGALTREQQALRQRLLDDYRNWLRSNSDRAEARVALAALYLHQGDVMQAQQNFDSALQSDPLSLAALLNYADFYRGMENDGEAEKLLRKALQIYPDSADAHFALGLLQVRQQHIAEAMPLLRAATRLAPHNSHYAYVYGVGLHSSGQVAQALTALADAQQKFPANGQIHSALQAYCAEPSLPRGHTACPR